MNNLFGTTIEKGVIPLISIGLGLLFFLACNQQERNRYTGEALREVDSLQDKMEADSGEVGRVDKQFVKTAKYSNLLEIEAGKLAVEAAENTAVRNFGKLMLTQHAQFDKDLMDIVIHRKVEIPKNLDASRKIQLEELKTKKGKAFDLAYMQLVTNDYQIALQAFADAGNQAKDVHIQAFANKNIGNIKTNLAEAEKLQTSVKSK